MDEPNAGERAEDFVLQAKENNSDRLYLNQRQLTALPRNLFDYHKLKHLDISSNSFSEWPSDLSKLFNLESISYTFNRLEVLPPEVGLLRVKKLNISHNKLTELPDELFEIDSLEELDIANNPLTRLPPAIGLLKNLKRLTIIGLGLTDLPPEIAELKQLEKLVLTHNSLTTFPQEICELENLHELWLPFNKIHKIPAVSAYPAFAQQWQVLDIFAASL